jgi:[acyl-carrier-protein] S-malonyltransferase
MKTALLFSGQGSQYIGMLKDVYENSSFAKDLIEHANEVVGFNLSSICFDGPVETLKETRYTQPAIFLHSAVVFSQIAEKLDFSGVAGHSVGEYAALYAAGVLSFDDAIRLVAKRGKLMFEAGTNLPGTMFAVINLDDEKLIEVCRELTEKGNGNVVVPANFNSPGQIVVSGSAEYLRQNVEAFKSAGARMVKELVVSGAFHSPLMEPAKLELENVINSIEFYDAKVPVYANVTAEPITDSTQIKELLINQLISPVLWTKTMENMNKHGFETVIEIGPGNVLQGLAKRTVSEFAIEGIDNYQDLQKYL